MGPFHLPVQKSLAIRFAIQTNRSRKLNALIARESLMDSSAVASASYWLSVLWWVKIVAAGLVTLGVALEFGGDWVSRPFERKVEEAKEAELTKLSSDTAHANLRAANAIEKAELLRRQNIELERMALPRRWYGPLAPSMRGAPTGTSLFEIMETESKLSSFANKISAKLQFVVGDNEAANLASQIKYGLSIARWNVSNLSPEQSGIPYVLDGVQLWTSPEHGDAFNAAESLEQSLKLEGIQAEGPDRPIHRYDLSGLLDNDIRKSLRPDTIIILVGSKPGYLDVLGKEGAAYRESHPEEK
jgi:hypothetical protein